MGQVKEFNDYRIKMDKKILTADKFILKLLFNWNSNTGMLIILHTQRAVKFWDELEKN